MVKINKKHLESLKKFGKSTAKGFDKFRDFVNETNVKIGYDPSGKKKKQKKLKFKLELPDL